MSIKTRFAPSPTGMLHVGNVRTALINWLFTRQHGGEFMLRMDDTDLLRSKPEYAAAIKNDLEWLGLSWDEYACQSDRLVRYEEAKVKLINSGRLYPCYETQNELDMKRKMQLSRGLPPIYDRSGLHEGPKVNSKPHYRFLLEDGQIEWDDLIRGNISFQARNLSDPIVIREDGSMTYMLCSAVDDIDFGITHILRGEDHITNTAIAIQLTKALGVNPPQIGHLSLLQSKTGEISKRIGGFDIQSLREKSIEPMAINSLLAKMGTSDPTDATNDMNKLITEFDSKKFSLSAVNYDFGELLHLNHKLINHMSYEQIKPSLDKLEVSVSKELWQAASGNLNSVAEIIDWWEVCNKDISPSIDSNNEGFLKEACGLLPAGDWDLGTWDLWIAEIKQKIGKTGKQLFMPLRISLTGKDHGPELKLLLPLIGRERVMGRLNGKTA